MLNVCADQKGAIRAESEHEIVLRGERIAYRVIAEETLFGDEKGAAASVFSYSYFRTDTENPGSRPVIFVYNGGPGSSSVWLHLGMFGPRKVKLADAVNPPAVPPYELEDNPYCLLDTCDLVMYDPVSTGLARLMREDAAAEVFGTDPDARIAALFIEHWLVKYERMNSPRYLAGESYGTIRSSQLLQYLMGAVLTKELRVLAIPVNGVFFLGTAITHGTQKPPYPKTCFDFLSMASVNWYFHREGKPASVQEFADEAEEFVENEYLRAIFMGERLPEEEREKVLDRMVYYTGVSKDWLREHHMEMTTEQFMEEALRKEELDVGIYDGRYTMPKNSYKRFHDVIADDPAMGKYTPAFVGAMELYKKEIGLKTDREYRAIDLLVNSHFTGEPQLSCVDCIVTAMRRNRNLKLFFGTGLYDLCTTAGTVRYNVSHMDLDQSRVAVKEYESGHMPYLGEESLSALIADMKEFMKI